MKTDLQDLTSAASDIVSCCRWDLQGACDQNRAVILVILDEFQKILDSIRTNGTIPVLNGKRQIWSCRTIVDSAGLARNDELLGRVRECEKLCKHIDRKYIAVQTAEPRV